MGWFIEEEIYDIVERDLLVVLEILGFKNFLFGDKLCLVDVVLFVFIVGLVLDCLESFYVKIIRLKVINLLNYV